MIDRKKTSFFADMSFNDFPSVKEGKTKKPFMDHNNRFLSDTYLGNKKDNEEKNRALNDFSFEVDKFVPPEELDTINSSEEDIIDKAFYSGDKNDGKNTTHSNEIEIDDLSIHEDQVVSFNRDSDFEDDILEKVNQIFENNNDAKVEQATKTNVNKPDPSINSVNDNKSEPFQNDPQIRKAWIEFSETLNKLV